MIDLIANNLRFIRCFLLKVIQTQHHNTLVFVRSANAILSIFITYGDGNIVIDQDECGVNAGQFSFCGHFVLSFKLITFYLKKCKLTILVLSSEENKHTVRDLAEKENQVRPNEVG